MGSELHAPEVAPRARPARLRRWLRFPRTWAEVRRLGWRAIAGFILFYLVRDLVLYVLIPYLIYRGVATP